VVFDEAVAVASYEKVEEQDDERGDGGVRRGLPGALAPASDI